MVAFSYLNKPRFIEKFIILSLLQSFKWVKCSKPIVKNNKKSNIFMTAAEAAPLISCLGYSMTVMQKVLGYLIFFLPMAFAEKGVHCAPFPRDTCKHRYCFNVIINRILLFSYILLENNIGAYIIVKQIVI